jgi:hypothetical protein
MRKEMIRIKAAEGPRICHLVDEDWIQSECITRGDHPSIKEKGNPPKSGSNTGKTLLGHKDLTMTLRYSHLAPALIQSAVTILDAALTGGQLDNFLTVGASGKEKGSAVAG